jgi:hypothetical protein
MNPMRLPKTGCQYRFTLADWNFIIDTLGLDQRGRDSLATLTDDPDSLRHILDHPKLFEAVLVTRRTAMLSADLFFFVLVRHTLKRIGVEDLEVADYVAVVCAEFGLPSVNPVSQKKPELPGLYNLDYIQALENARGPERFFVHVQCANRFLVLTCLYPAFLHHRAERRGAPDVEYYEQVVISNLDAASHHVLASEFALHNVLVNLAGAFPPVRRAMNYTLREYLNLGC